MNFEQSDHASSKLIVRHIVATMSDRAPMEVNFDTLLKDYRKAIMHTVIANYDQMSEDERKAIGYIANFFCGLLLLSTLPNAAGKNFED